MLKELRVTRRDKFAEAFAERLRTLLRRHYGGRLPSAAGLARDLSAHGLDADRAGVPPETARRWMRGQAVPEMRRFSALCLFLGLTPAEVASLALANAAELPADVIERAGESASSFDIRAQLHRLINSTPPESLAAAYVAFLVSSGKDRDDSEAGLGDLRPKRR